MEMYSTKIMVRCQNNQDTKIIHIRCEPDFVCDNILIAVREGVVRLKKDSCWQRDGQAVILTYMINAEVCLFVCLSYSHVKQIDVIVLY